MDELCTIYNLQNFTRKATCFIGIKDTSCIDLTLTDGSRVFQIFFVLEIFLFIFHKSTFIVIKMCNAKQNKTKQNKKNNFMAPFYGWGSTASRLEPLRGGSLLFTTKFQKFLVLKS